MPPQAPCWVAFSCLWTWTLPPTSLLITAASPLVSRYGAWYRAVQGVRPPEMESQPAHEHRAPGSGALQGSQPVVRA